MSNTPTRKSEGLCLPAHLAKRHKIDTDLCCRSRNNRKDHRCEGAVSYHGHYKHNDVGICSRCSTRQRWCSTCERWCTFRNFSTKNRKIAHGKHHGQCKIGTRKTGRPLGSKNGSKLSLGSAGFQFLDTNVADILSVLNDLDNVPTNLFTSEPPPENKQITKLPTILTPSHTPIPNSSHFCQNKDSPIQITNDSNPDRLTQSNLWQERNELIPIGTLGQMHGTQLSEFDYVDFDLSNFDTGIF